MIQLKALINQVHFDNADDATIAIGSHRNGTVRRS